MKREILAAKIETATTALPQYTAVIEDIRKAAEAAIFEVSEKHNEYWYNIVGGNSKYIYIEHIDKMYKLIAVEIDKSEIPKDVNHVIIK